MNGWMGKIIWVDLTDRRIKIVPTQSYAEKYLGGRGIASRIYWENVSPKVEAFSPENVLSFITGPLIATGVQGATRMAITAKSPWSQPEGYSFGNIGGFVGAEIKKAGYDGIIVTGKADRPVYLSIQDDQIEVKDASFLWGQGAYRTAQSLQEIYGEKMRYIVTGVAGEKLVRLAVAFASHEGTARVGLGAVMGSKNLKAIAVLGSVHPTVADPDKVKELNLYTVKIAQRLKSSSPPSIGPSRAHLLEAIGNGGCYQCALECHRKLYIFGKRLQGYRRCQAMEYYLPWRYGRDDEPVDTLFDSPTLANDYSLDTNDIARIIEWLYSSCKAGALAENEVGLPLSKIGTREFLEKLLHMIAYREGFGDILAEGLARAYKKLPAKARAILSPAAAAGGREESSPPGAIIPFALLSSMEPRAHVALTHEISRTRMVWLRARTQPDVSPVNGEVWHKIAKAFWGSEAAGDLSTYEGKALAVKKVQDRTYLKDALGLCDACWPIVYSLNTPDHVGDPDLEGRLFEAVTGIPADRLQEYAERIFNQQRAILLREGRQTPATDMPPESSFKERVKAPGSQSFLVPGPGEEAVDAAGRALDKDLFSEMLMEYYTLRGWDKSGNLRGTIA